MLAPGLDVDRYRVERVLGVGGMASVYLVRHRLLGSSHALKLMTHHGPRLHERLWREGRAQAQLRHPNLVAVTDVVEVDGAPALVLEFVPGPTLDEHLLHHPLTDAEAEALFRGVVDGVETAHAAGLVHRDLKPSNILLDRQGDRLVPKVADFGLVKVVEDSGLGVAGGETPLTRGAGAMGTPAYMAPEQVRDARDVDQRADIFALGCILYEMVCGQRAFAAADPFATQELVVHGRYPPPESVRPDLDPRLAAVIRACLAVDRADRPSDCATLRALLDGATPAPRPRAEAWTAARAPAAHTLSPALSGDDEPEVALPEGATAVPPTAAPPTGGAARPWPPGPPGRAPAGPTGAPGGPPGEAVPSLGRSGRTRGSEDSGPRSGGSWARTFAFVWVVLGAVGVGLWGVDRAFGPRSEPVVAAAAPPVVADAGEVLAGPPAPEPRGGAEAGGAPGGDAPVAVAPPAGSAAGARDEDGGRTGGGAPTSVAATSAPAASAATGAVPSPEVASASPDRESPPAAAARPASPAMGRLVLTSKPYAVISVDGAPYRPESPLPAGPHEVRWECRAERCAGEVHVETVRVDPGQTATYCWSFELDARCVGG